MCSHGASQGVGTPGAGPSLRPIRLTSGRRALATGPSESLARTVGADRAGATRAISAACLSDLAHSERQPPGSAAALQVPGRRRLGTHLRLRLHLHLHLHLHTHTHTHTHTQHTHKHTAHALQRAEAPTQACIQKHARRPAQAGRGIAGTDRQAETGPPWQSCPRTAVPRILIRPRKPCAPKAVKTCRSCPGHVQVTQDSRILIRPPDLGAPALEGGRSAAARSQASLRRAKGGSVSFHGPGAEATLPWGSTSTPQVTNAGWSCRAQCPRWGRKSGLDGRRLRQEHAGSGVGRAPDE